MRHKYIICEAGILANSLVRIAFMENRMELGEGKYPGIFSSKG